MDSDAFGLCTFDTLTVTKSGALHWVAVVTHPAGLNSPLSIESGRFHIKPK